MLNSQQMAKAYKRDSPFPVSVAEEIIERLTVGENPNTISQLPGMPSAPTIYNWAAGVFPAPTPTFAKDYARARSIGREANADRMEGIWDGAKPEDVPALKGKLETMKWAYAKMDKARWGDKLEIAGDPSAPLQISHTVRKLADVYSPEELEAMEQRMVE